MVLVAGSSASALAMGLLAPAILQEQLPLR